MEEQNLDRINRSTGVDDGGNRLNAQLQRTDRLRSQVEDITLIQGTVVVTGTTGIVEVNMVEMDPLGILMMLVGIMHVCRSGHEAEHHIKGATAQSEDPAHLRMVPDS